MTPGQRRPGVDGVGDWIQTWSGRQFWPLDPHPDDVYLPDIVHALSNVCRFTGHVREFYSVAEHSVRVSREVERSARALGRDDAAAKRLALCALFHDASEAYLVDLSRPVKLAVPGYREAEDRVTLVIGDVFGVRYDGHPVATDLINTADTVLLFAEARDLMHKPPNRWKGEVPDITHVAPINPWAPLIARDLFYTALRRLSPALYAQHVGTVGTLSAAYGVFR